MTAITQNVVVEGASLSLEDLHNCGFRHKPSPGEFDLFMGLDRWLVCWWAAGKITIIEIVPFSFDPQ
ncbi:MAG: hypothetical protein WCG48_03320 [Candidatus Berkelbacteria bacterium]